MIYTYFIIHNNRAIHFFELSKSTLVNSLDLFFIEKWRNISPPTSFINIGNIYGNFYTKISLLQKLNFL